MRLVCPNCDAEYEVDAALIPDAGRDVQCSNCGHAWFQASLAIEASAAAEDALFAPDAGLEMAKRESSVPGGGHDDDEFALQSDPRQAEFGASVTAAGPATRNIDESVLAVLREEAERESRARRAEASGIETQDEMGLDGKAPGGVSDRIARMKGDAEVHSAADLAGARGGQAKSGLLPEIDAINSTLRAKSERRNGESSAISDTFSPESTRKGGFRRGFLMAMVLLIVALGLYLAAPMLIERFPSAASPLRAYVGYVDVLRGLIDQMLRFLIVRITGLIGSA
jgi:predicted Zn finger-like uncharacterized protein